MTNEQFCCLDDIESAITDLEAALEALNAVDPGSNAAVYLIGAVCKHTTELNKAFYAACDVLRGKVKVSEISIGERKLKFVDQSAIKGTSE